MTQANDLERLSRGGGLLDDTYDRFREAALEMRKGRDVLFGNQSRDFWSSGCGRFRSGKALSRLWRHDRVVATCLRARNDLALARYHDAGQMESPVYGTFWFVVPSLPMF